ncbi:Annexin A13 [Euphorbia peplus]|nr:Annexin A13 [Euphorbia peplus]
MGTKILPSAPNQSFETECKQIHDSPTSINQLVRSLASRSKSERQQIRQTYKQMYGEDITTFLENLCVNGSKVCSVLSLWIIDPHERDAVVVKQALEQAPHTNYKAIVEIFVGRKSSHVMLMKQIYQARFRKPLDQDIINLEPPHPYQKILIALGASHKAHEVEVSQHIGKCDAKRIYEAGEGGSGGIQEGVVLEILSKRSIQQMILTFSSYKHIYGHEYTKSLEKGKREFEDALRNVIKCMCYPSNYYAKALYRSMKGTASERESLARVIMSRAEIDMDYIKQSFCKKYGTQLTQAILESIPSGDYRDFLVGIIQKY